MKEHTMKRTLFAVLALAVLIPLITPEQADAVPSFARRWKISCTTCHDPFPRLKDFGAEFAGNGFVIPESDDDRAYVNTGDELLRLNKDFPLAGRFDAYAVWEQDAEIDADLQTPWGMKLLSGGPVAEGVGYYFYFYLSERGEVAGIEDAIIHFDSVFDSGLDIAVGQFQTSDPLMKRELRLTFEDYLLYKTKVGDSSTDLTYDRGLMLSYGIEATGTDLVVTVTNGNGKGEADANRKFDNDSRKNIGLRLLQGVGDVGSVGWFTYFGKEAWSEPGVGVMDNDITWYGPDVALSLGNLALTGQYLIREDSSPLMSGLLQDVETTGLIVEAVFAPRGDRSNHWFTLLYNKIDSDVDALDTERWALGGTRQLARNLRLMAEFGYDVTHETSQVVVGTVTAF
jgi:hypothetical protein